MSEQPKLGGLLGLPRADRQAQIDVIALEAARAVATEFSQIRDTQHQARVQVIIAAAIKEALDNV